MEFTRQDMEEILSKLNEIKAPYKMGKVDEMSPGFPSLYIRISLDPQESWANNIFHNSRHMHFFYHTQKDYYNNAGKLYADSSKTGKFRKCSPKSVQDVIDRINKFLDDNR